MPREGRRGIYNFPIPFKERVDAVVASNSDSQGEFVDNAFAYAINLNQYYCAMQRSDGLGLSDPWFTTTLIAIGK